MAIMYLLVPHTINVCVENKNKESEDSSSDGGMEIEDANKMQAFACATVVPKATAAVGMFHDLNGCSNTTIIYLFMTHSFLPTL